MQSDIFELSTLVAPEDDCGQRGLPRGTVVKTPDFWDRYDNSTLIYDCVWRPQEKVVRIYLPKPIGFARYLSQASFTLGSEPTSIAKWRKFRHHDEIEFRSPQKPEVVGIVAGNARFSVIVNDDQSHLFLGRNVLYTMLKNDNLQWVYDWGVAHQRNHGTDAILVVNNGSSAYTSSQLLRAIRKIPGIEVAHVLDARLKYGPSPKSCTGVGATTFLQTACMNVCRDRFFSRARGVLICDVDELVFSHKEESIYDATANSLTKYKTFHGHWRLAKKTDALIRHKDHIYLDVRTKPCPSKYCVVPDSFLGQMCWSIHSLENVNRRIFRPSSRFGFYHCRSVNTSWKANRSSESRDQSVVDPVAAAFLKATFPTSN
jgi:hypothetical protein